MKKLIFLILAFLIVGCSKMPSEEIPTIDFTEPVTDSKKNYSDFVDELETVYNATSFGKAIERHIFTADIIDNYKGKNIIVKYCDIEDIFYLQGNKYLYGEASHARFQLQLTDEQHQKIKALRSETHKRLCVIFELTDVQANHPNIDMDLTIDVYTPDDIQSDFYSSTVYDFRLVKGIVVDIVEI